MTKQTLQNIYIIQGVNLMVQDLLRKDARIQDLYFHISEIKLLITSLFSVQIMSYLGAWDMIYSDVINSFITEILKYKSWILASWHKRSWTERFTPYFFHLFRLVYRKVWISRSRLFCARTQGSRICTSISLKWSYQSHRCILYLMPLSMTLFGLKTAMWLIASFQRY